MGLRRFRLHVLDLGYPAGAIHESQRQRETHILHPERSMILVIPQEQHDRTAVRESSLEPDAALLLVQGDWHILEHHTWRPGINIDKSQVAALPRAVLQRLRCTGHEQCPVLSRNNSPQGRRRPQTGSAYDAQ